MVTVHLDRPDEAAITPNRTADPAFQTYALLLAALALARLATAYDRAPTKE